MKNTIIRDQVINNEADKFVSIIVLSSNKDCKTNQKPIFITLIFGSPFENT